MSHEPFNQDVARNGGYVYTTNNRLSSRLANRRQTRALLQSAHYEDKRVLDIGCGDGTYTCELFDAARPACIHGVDPAEEAITSARGKAQGRPVTFSVASAYTLPFGDDSFDVACLRGVLHHLNQPAAALHEALRVAGTLVVIEPNGYNPVLKVIERVSPYHVAHEEKSYPPRLLDRWVREQGGRVTRRRFSGLVPFFCPDWMARALKDLEPWVERVPGLSGVACGNYVFSAAHQRVQGDLETAPAALPINL